MSNFNPRIEQVDPVSTTQGLGPAIAPPAPKVPDWVPVRDKPGFEQNAAGQLRTKDHQRSPPSKKS